MRLHAALVPLQVVLMLVPACGSGNTSGGVPIGDAGPSDSGEVVGCPETPEVGVVSEEDAPLSLAIDATHIYWTAAEPDGSGGYVHRIRRAAKSGGAAETFAQADGETGAVALTRDVVVWVEGTPGGSGASAVRMSPKSGGAVTDVARFTAAEGTLDVFSLQVSETDAFVLQKRFAADFRYAVLRVPFSGDGPEEVAVHSLPIGTDARSMVLDDGTVFWAFLSGWIYGAQAAGVAGADAVPLLDVAEGVDGWTVRGSEVLFLSSGSVWSTSRAGGALSEAVHDVSAYRALATTAAWVVWGARDHAGSETIRGRKSAGEVCTLVTEGVVSAYSTAVDGDRVYWTNTASKTAGGAVRWVSVE